MKKNRTAIIIGVNGQDGRILFDQLMNLDYSIIGVDRGSVKTNKVKWRKKVNIGDKKDVFELIKKTKPEEIYYLAAFHFSSQDYRLDLYSDLLRSYEVNTFAFLNFLEGIRLFSKRTKIFYASSSLVFGSSKTSKQDENTPLNPDGAYGVTKMNGVLLSRIYREKYNIFASVGILYNHESELRSDNFISMKIIKSALNIKKGLQKELVIGDLSAIVDWGYAHDYVKAMREILNLKTADNFVIATGKSHTVLEFVKIAFEFLDLDWKKYVKVNDTLVGKKKTSLVGDTKKLREATQWKPSLSFSKMIKKIITDLK